MATPEPSIAQRRRNPPDPFGIDEPSDRLPRVILAERTIGDSIRRLANAPRNKVGNDAILQWVSAAVEAAIRRPQGRKPLAAG